MREGLVAFSRFRFGAVRQCRMFRRRNEGATAVEFAIVLAPFAALLFAIMETALVFFSQQVLETATADASRLIFTGQAQGGNLDAAGFKKAICDRVPTLFDCNGMVSVDVRTVTSFANANVATPVKNGQVDKSGFGYNPGTAGDIVIVRAIMEYPVIVNFMNAGLSNLTNGKRLIMASSAFRNEPFGN